MALEPLLKDEEEKIVFGNDKKGKNKSKNSLKSCLNKSVILTVILTMIVFYFFGRVSYAFYIGYRYYNLRFVSTTVEVANSNTVDDLTSDNEEVPLSSAILQTTYNKINLNNCNDLLSKFYSSSIDVSSLTLEDKLGLALNYLNSGTCTSEISISDSELNTAFIELFNDSSLLQNYQVSSVTYDNYIVSYDEENSMFYITNNNCVTCDNNFVVKNLSSATSDDEYLYIYEKFGYFNYIEDNTYEVYNDMNKTSLITTFSDIDGTSNFTNYDILATYMWTYKKGTDNNYYFVSVTRL